MAEARGNFSRSTRATRASPSVCEEKPRQVPRRRRNWGGERVKNPRGSHRPHGKVAVPGNRELRHQHRGEHRVGEEEPSPVRGAGPSP